MNRDEYIRWARHHAALFPSWGDNRRTLRNAVEVSRQMERQLSGVDLDDCIQASTDMADGVIEKPIAYDDHVLAVRRRASDLRFAREPKPRWVGNEEVFRCTHCRDSGWRARATRTTLDNAQSGVFDALIEFYADYYDAIGSQLNDYEQERIAAMQFLDSCKAVASSMRPRPSLAPRELYRYELVACTCSRGGTKEGVARFNESVDCDWDPGAPIYRNLLRCRSHEVGNADLSSAISDWQNEI